MSMLPKASTKATVGILTHTAIADDPRVRRQIEAFAAAGWCALGLGARGARSEPPPGKLFEADMPRDDRSSRTRMRRLALLSAVKALPRLADQAFWLLPERYQNILKAAEGYHPDLWIANDWTMLPVVQKLADRDDTPFIYDTHEFASNEFPENWKWRTFVRPLVTQIEGRGIARAAHVTCVSAGIATRLQEIYGLRQAPCVVRNLPSYSAHAFRPTGERVEVLYHGIVMPNRGLEDIIRSVGQWRREFALTIRGPAATSYLHHLIALATELGVSERIRFDPPVPLTSLVAAAARHDIGIFVLPAHSPQSEFVLPNKLFEYIMAGLALCVSDLPEMAGIVEKFSAGELIKDLSADAIASTINSFDRQRIDAFKQRSIEAAKELCWEREQNIMLEIAQRLVFGQSRSNFQGRQCGSSVR